MIPGGVNVLAVAYENRSEPKGAGGLLVQADCRLRHACMVTSCTAPLCEILVLSMIPP